MSLQETFIAGFRWIAASRLLVQIISWVGTLYVMRLLAPADYGLAAICSSVVTVAVLVSEFGFGTAIIQATTLSRQQTRSIFGVALGFSSGVALIVIAAAPALGAYFRAPEAVLLVQVSAAHLLLSALATVPDASLRRRLDFKALAAIDVVCGITSTISTVALAWTGYGVWALVLGPISGTALRTVLLHCALRELLIPSLRFTAARDLISFGLKISLSRMAGYVFGQADILIAGRYLSKTALGEYSVAMHLAMLPVTKIMAIVNSVSLPFIAELNRTGEDVRMRLSQGLRLFSYVLVPLLWGLAAVSPWLIPAVLGPAWTQAVLPLQIISAVLPLRLVSVLMSTALQGLGHAGLDLRNTLTGVMILPACFLAGSFYGAPGLACAWLIGLPVVLFVNIRRCAAVLGIGLRVVVRSMCRPAMFSAVMVGAITLVGRVLDGTVSSGPLVGALILTGASAYLALLWLLDRRSAKLLLAFARPTIGARTNSMSSEEGK